MDYLKYLKKKTELLMQLLILDHEYRNNLLIKENCIKTLDDVIKDLGVTKESVTGESIISQDIHKKGFLKNAVLSEINKGEVTEKEIIRNLKLRNKDIFKKYSIRSISAILSKLKKENKVIVVSPEATVETLYKLNGTTIS